MKRTGRSGRCSISSSLHPWAEAIRSTTNLRLGRLQLRRRAVLGRRESLFDERIPFMALRALPEQLGAPVAAAHADVRVEIEDGFTGQRDIPADERRLEAECGQRLPDLLVNGEPVRVVGNCV